MRFVFDANDDLTVTQSTGAAMKLTLAEAAALRLFLNANNRRLRPTKTWDKCPYENHHDSCDCNGVAGDR